jgi:hypothetical protein
MRKKPRRWSTMIVRRGLIGLAACLAALSVGRAAGAEMMWAYEFEGACAQGSPNLQLCVRFVDGFVRGLKVQAQSSNTRLPFCLPDGTGPEELADAFNELLEKYPQFRAFDAGGFLHLTFSVKWRGLQS